MSESASASTQELERAALDSLDAAKSESELEEWRIEYLGRRGVLSSRLRSVGALPVEERREAGASLNRLKNRLSNAFDEASERASGSADRRSTDDGIDITFAGASS